MIFILLHWRHSLSFNTINFMYNINSRYLYLRVLVWKSRTLLKCSMLLVHLNSIDMCIGCATNQIAHM